MFFAFNLDFFLICKFFNSSYKNEYKLWLFLNYFLDQFWYLLQLRHISICYLIMQRKTSILLNKHLFFSIISFHIIELNTMKGIKKIDWTWHGENFKSKFRLQIYWSTFWMFGGFNFAWNIFTKNLPKCQSKGTSRWDLKKKKRFLFRN